MDKFVSRESFWQMKELIRAVNIGQLLMLLPNIRVQSGIVNAIPTLLQRNFEQTRRKKRKGKTNYIFGNIIELIKSVKES